MALEDVSAKLAAMEDDEAIVVQFDFGSNLAESVELYGEDVVYTRYKSAAVIDLQAYMRGMIRAEKSPDEIEEAVGNWKPGVKAARGKSAVEKLETLMGKLSDEDRDALFKKYMSGGAEEAEAVA